MQVTHSAGVDAECVTGRGHRASPHEGQDTASLTALGWLYSNGAGGRDAVPTGEAE